MIEKNFPGCKRLLPIIQTKIAALFITVEMKLNQEDAAQEFQVICHRR